MMVAQDEVQIEQALKRRFNYDNSVFLANCVNDAFENGFPFFFDGRSETIKYAKLFNELYCFDFFVFEHRDNELSGTEPLKVKCMVNDINWYYDMFKRIAPRKHRKQAYTSLCSGVFRIEELIRRYGEYVSFENPYQVYLI